MSSIDWHKAYEGLAAPTKEAVDHAAEEVVRTLHYHGFTYLLIEGPAVPALRDGITRYLLVAPEGGH